jgi:hypothetical protein
MTDWTAIAKARGLDIPAEDVKRISPALASLEEAFRPLLKKLNDSIEPAIILSETAVLGK